MDYKWILIQHLVGIYLWLRYSRTRTQYPSFLSCNRNIAGLSAVARSVLRKAGRGDVRWLLADPI